MANDLADLAAAIGRRIKEQNPEYADWPDAELGAQLLVQQQGQVHALFQSSNEKDPQGNAVVRPNQYGQALQEQTPPLAFLAPYLERGMDLLRGATGLGDQGPAGQTWTNAGALLAAAAPFIPGKALKALATGERAAEGAESAAQGIRAYHGSPHDFDKFSVEKIGTGEGAQAYGHGLYFAESEPVAESYRRKLASSNAVDARMDTLLQKHQGALEPALDEFMQSVYDTPAAKAKMRASLARQWTARPPVGRMYEVTINADPEHFLDWDKPLSQQSDRVKQALEAAGIKADNRMLADLRAAHGDEYPTGADLYTATKSAAGEHPVQGSGQAASARLRDVGVPGIKYLDAASRGPRPAYRGDTAYLHAAESFQSAGHSADEALAGLQRSYEGAEPADLQAAVYEVYDIQPPRSRNYVIFDDKVIEMLRKYGLLPPLAAAAGARALQPSDQPPNP